MKPHYDTIYLSPHLDDAVLSCGGQIYQQTQAGKQVLILTIMAGDPSQSAHSTFVELLHQRWQLADDATAVRRAEDAEACAMLGADYWHWELPDCIYRSDPQTGAALYDSEVALFGEVQAADTPLGAALLEQMRRLPAHDRLLGPLTVGHHVDHQIVRRAMEQLDHAAAAYYEDYPYAAVPGAVQRALTEDDRSWLSEIVPLREEDLQAKIAAIAAYESQVSTFFRDWQELDNMIRAFTAETGGERLWRLS